MCMWMLSRSGGKVKEWTGVEEQEARMGRMGRRGVGGEGKGGVHHEICK